MKILGLSYIFLSLIITILGCSGSLETTGSMSHTRRLPDFVLAKSNALIITQTGYSFFHDYVKYKSTIFRHSVSWPMYTIQYSFSIPNKSGIHGLIVTYFDSVGNVMANFPAIGIPSCQSNPNSCSFDIDSVKATSIANHNGLSKGIGPVQISFKWFGKPKQYEYAWEIRNRLSGEDDSSIEQVLIIDAHSGVVLENYTEHVQRNIPGTPIKQLKIDEEK